MDFPEMFPTVPGQPGFLQKKSQPGKLASKIDRFLPRAGEILKQRKHLLIFWTDIFQNSSKTKSKSAFGGAEPMVPKGKIPELSLPVSCF